MARSPSGGARAVATLAFCAAAATATGACNALTGASGLHENDQEAITDPPPVVTPQPSTPVDDGGGGAVVDVYVKPDPPKGCPSEGRSCTPRAPANWEGPLFLYDGDPAMAPQLCPTSMAVQRVDAHGGKPVGTTTCSSCGCGSLTNVTCSATLRQYTDLTCATAPTTSTLTSTCTPFAVGTLAVSVTTTAQGGSCNSFGGNPTKGSVTWPSTIRACGAPVLLPDGCPDAELCVPNPPPPYRGKHCISRGGDHACPAPWSDKHAANERFDDTRGCTNCQCTVAQNVTCDGSARYADTNAICAIPTLSKGVPLSCMAVAAGTSIRLTSSTTLDATGSCSKVDDSKPTGGLSETDPVTVCCLP